MITISRSDAKKSVEAFFNSNALMNIVDSSRLLRFSLWFGRSVFTLPVKIKYWGNCFKHPVSAVAGQLLDLSGFAEKRAMIVVACRVVTILRPLIELMDRVSKVKNSVRTLVKKKDPDNRLLGVFQKMERTKITLPGFFSKIGTLMRNSYELSINIIELIDAMTAPNEDIVKKSLLDLHAIVMQLEEGKLLHALEEHKEWLNGFIKKMKISMDVETVKSIVISIGQYDISNLSESTVTSAVEVVTQGVLDLRL